MSSVTAEIGTSSAYTQAAAIDFFCVQLKVLPRMFPRKRNDSPLHPREKWHCGHVSINAWPLTN